MPQEVITDRLLRSWLRCRRRAWLDRHGDPDRRLWTAHRALALSDQLASFQLLLPERPSHGEAACAAGAPGVVGVRLHGGGPSGQDLQAHPPLLQRVAGRSVWGGHAYRPVLGRQGRNLTREHRLVLALWGRLLERRQQAPVPQALVVASDGRGLQQERLTLSSSLQRQLDDSLDRLTADLQRSQSPPLVADRKKCVLCSWRGLCDQEAAGEGHLSEVSGIGGRRREMLLEQGITSLAELANADPQQLAEALALHGDQHREVAAQLVAQAQVQASGRPLRLHPDGPADPLPELSQAPGVLLYDIESDPDARDDFLHGFVVLPRGADDRWPPACPAGGAWRYQPLLARHDHGEARLWQRLQRLLARYPGWPLLHYGETEAIALIRLAGRQGAREAELAALRARLLDVHARVRRHWLLPVSSYGLKAVASWVGFRWSQPGVDGARCLLWWRQWRRDGGTRRLQRIFTYNRDDNLATWAVVRWLLDQQQHGVEAQRD
ncbi:TM0106 family RecB-like putative nuclease [Cyanobium sp. NIES-981]|uniref:TM0106 family RecB-like putative nuclease n=1 Tax=Cyanobium sp. NIES-981 TaxID=1851505 RepID=UPI0007DCF0D3|nr:TM0106 family RecB-like putative nuclease [Cyanobium sp. NIES-981]SBO43709.1 DNA repair enzyme, contains HhH domain and nuclease of RecB family [Cyanobium sp. NIES-981]